MKRLIPLLAVALAVAGVTLAAVPALAQDYSEEELLVPQDTAGEDQYGPEGEKMSAAQAAAIRNIAVEAAENALKDDSGADEGVAAYTAALKAARSAGAGDEFAEAAAKRAVEVADAGEPAGEAAAEPPDSEAAAASQPNAAKASAEAAENASEDSGADGASGTDEEATVAAAAAAERADRVADKSKSEGPGGTRNAGDAAGLLNAGVVGAGLVGVLLAGGFVVRGWLRRGL